MGDIGGKGWLGRGSTPGRDPRIPARAHRAGHWRRAAMATVAAGALTVGLPSLAAAATRPPATIKATVKATIKATIKATATTTVREGRAAVGHSPRLPADAARVGAVPAGRTVNGVIGLKPQHAPALADFAKAISTPGTPEYHHYL